uniref:Uncharacterized protein n=1 Tax=Kalanchoe fedtschenkoi TaxID=63787 RepID=A0A7N0T3X4_KALFE
MAANQLLTFRSDFLSSNPKPPSRSWPPTSISSSTTSTLSLGLWPRLKTGRVGLSGVARCSIAYNDNFSEVAYPKPSEVPWKKELCNSVQLIGVVGKDVEIKHFSSGKVLAWTSLAVKKSATDTSWINLTFWDELAHIASQHVAKGQQIYVSGRLVSDVVEVDGGKQETYYKVVVQQINFVEKSSPAVPLYGQSTYSNVQGQATSWTSSNKPAFGSNSTEALWQAFFANPVDWWDNRKNKKSPKHPDFKHKDTGEALWIEGRNNPHWVPSQLSILDSRRESFTDQNRGSYMGGDEFSPF